METPRRAFVLAAAAASAAALLPRLSAQPAPAPAAPGPAEIKRRRPPLPPERVFEFVRAGHNNLPRLKAMLEEEPGLLNATWDWAAGDWETALGGAAHLGNRPIAEFLLERGARIDAFAAAMLGYADMLRGMLRASPPAARAKGPHGFTLLYHVAISGDVSLAETLKPLVPNAADYNQALGAAVRGGHVEMTRWLLANGVDDRGQPDGLGKTPFQLAREKGLGEIEALLR